MYNFVHSYFQEIVHFYIDINIVALTVDNLKCFVSVIFTPTSELSRNFLSVFSRYFFPADVYRKITLCRVFDCVQSNGLFFFFYDCNIFDENGWNIFRRFSINAIFTNLIYISFLFFIFQTPAFLRTNTYTS